MRLAGFFLALAAAFGIALAAGSLAGPQHDPATLAATGHGAMEHDVRGLAVSDHGLTLRLSPAGAALRFSIVDDDGDVVRDFDVAHARRMHLIVVRRDLTHFQHLHPVQEADGSWSVPLRLDVPGTYRVFADFVHDGEPVTLADDLPVDGAVTSQPLPAPATSTTVDGLRVEDRGDLDFAVTRGGHPVALEDYLAAKGHLVALREGDLAFLHVHPDEDRLRFDAEYPTPGRYRLFLQFRTGGRVHTAAFTREVTP
jgi:hypothetical protein